MAACGEDKASFFDPGAHQNPDAGGDQGVDAGADAAADAGTSPTDPVLGGTVEPPQPDPDFVSQWATIDDPQKICAGFGHSCGIRDDGSAACWGGNGAGQTGPIPDEVFTTIACGEQNTCAITEDGRIVCWGSNGFGQSDAPTEGEFTEVACGEVHCCAIDSLARLHCWGAGTPDAEPHIANKGQATPPPGEYRGVIAGRAHSCAIGLATDEAFCWGGGDGFRCFPPEDVTCGQTTPPPGAFRALAGGFTHTCGITQAGNVVCWGQGVSVGACDPSSGGVTYDCGQSAPIDGDFLRIGGGELHTCVIDSDWGLFCQGRNVAVADTPSGELFSQVAAGIEHSCAIRRNGTVVCWGNGPNGETDPVGFP